MINHLIQTTCRILKTLVLLALVAGVCKAQTPFQGQTQVLTLSVGQAHVLNEPQIKRIAVGNGKILQATALDDKQVLIIPEAAGQSTLHLWSRAGERLIQIYVVPSDANRLLSEVSGLLGEASGVTARVVGDKVILEGASANQSTANRVTEIAKRYPAIVNLVNRTAVERMIAIDVRMVEIRRDLMQNIGVKWSGQAQGPSFGIIGDLHRSDRLRPGGAGSDAPGMDVRRYSAPFGTAISLATNLTSMLNLMVNNGDAVILAEPRLSCRSGGQAKFIAGGELPIPVSSGLGQTSVSFKEYGVKFDVSPVANDQGVISAKIGTEISALNFDVMIQNIPGLSKRRADTEVNLRENQTLVIAGLVTDDMSRHVDKVPALGDVPILGKLFRSRQFREQQTELVVMITPRFVSGETVTLSSEDKRDGSSQRTPLPDRKLSEVPQRVKQVRQEIGMLE